MTDGATNAGSIYHGDFDTWTFTAIQCDYMTLSVRTLTLSPSTTLFRSRLLSPTGVLLGNSSTQTGASNIAATAPTSGTYTVIIGSYLSGFYDGTGRSEEHTSELQSHHDLVCRLLRDTKTNGATNAGSIYQGDFDTCTCTATLGDYIVLCDGTATPATYPLSLHDALPISTGVLLGNSSTQTGASNIAATAPTSGTYTVIIGSYVGGFYDGTGSYLLTLAKGPDRKSVV